MARTTQIQGKGHALLVNGEMIKRIQSLDFGSDLAVENILELANASFVERKPDNPKVSISFDVNDFGSMANLALFKNGIQFSEVGSYAVSHDSTGVFYPTYSGNDVVRMADPNYDLDHQLCPSVLVKISEHNNTTLDRTCHIQGAYLDSVDFSYDVGGFAKESFKMSSDQKIWYFNGTLNNTDIDLEFPDTTGITTPVTTLTTRSNATGKRIVAVYLNRNMIYHADQNIGYAPTWSGTTFTLNVSDTNTIAVNDRLEIVYANTTPRQFPKLNTTNTGTKGALRRGAVVIYAYKSTDSATPNRMFRLQSVTGSLDLGRQERYELGTQRYIDKPTTYPLNVRFDMTFNSSDLEAMAIWQGKKAEWDAGTLSSMDIRQFIDTCGVKIEIYSDEVDHSANKLAKTITIAHCKVVTDGDTARIGNTAGQWRATVSADSITWSGSGNALD